MIHWELFGHEMHFLQYSKVQYFYTHEMHAHAKDLLHSAYTTVL